MCVCVKCVCVWNVEIDLNRASFVSSKRVFFRSYLVREHGDRNKQAGIQRSNLHLMKMKKKKKDTKREKKKKNTKHIWQRQLIGANSVNFWKKYTCAVRTGASGSVQEMLSYARISVLIVRNWMGSATWSVGGGGTHAALFSSQIFVSCICYNKHRIGIEICKLRIFHEKGTQFLGGKSA